MKLNKYKPIYLNIKRTVVYILKLINLVELKEKFLLPRNKLYIKINADLNN